MTENLISTRLRGKGCAMGLLTDVNVRNTLLPQDLPHLLRQLNTHVLSATVDRQPIDAGVRACKVHDLEE